VLRAKALEIIRAWRRAGRPEPYVPTREELHEMINFLLGFDFPAGYVPMILEDMAFEGTDARAFRWNRSVSAGPKQAHPVLVIGAGMSGMLMGLRLEQPEFRSPSSKRTTVVAGPGTKISTRVCGLTSRATLTPSRSNRIMLAASVFEAERPTGLFPQVRPAFWHHGSHPFRNRGFRRGLDSKTASWACDARAS